MNYFKSKYINEVNFFLKKTTTKQKLCSKKRSEIIHKK